MAAQWDTSRYLSLFVGEATEHLDALGKELVRLEGGVTTEAIDSLFRHAHSVKGMAGSMGYESTTALAHSLEDLLDRVRSAPARLDRSVADQVLQVVDALGGHVKAANANAPFPDSSLLITQLKALTASLELASSHRTSHPPRPRRCSNLRRSRNPTSRLAGRSPCGWPRTRRSPACAGSSRTSGSLPWATSFAARRRSTR